MKTLKVEGGSTLGFGLSSTGPYGKDESENTGDVGFPFCSRFSIHGLSFSQWSPDQYTRFVHDGPATAYLSKAPGEPNDYAGDGDWFKIAAVGATDGILWDYRETSGLKQAGGPSKKP